MTRALVIGGTLAALLVLVVLAARVRGREVDARSAVASSAGAPAGGDTEPDQGFLYGRITGTDGAVYEGRLRWGRGDQEAFWGSTFNGAKKENTWLARIPEAQRPKEMHRVMVLGLTVGQRERPLDVDRLFMARFGDITRIDASGRDVRVTLKSGTAFDLDRFEASDFDDGVRVWDVTKGIVDLDSLKIRSIELLPEPTIGTGPSRLYGTVRTRSGDFTGFIEWNREQSVGADALTGRVAEKAVGVRFDAIRSIARRSHGSALVTLRDGKEVELAVGEGHRGIYVDDPRYGRVLVSWDAFESVAFEPHGSGPAYGDFPPGRPLAGTVTTRAGATLAGRLVYDLDESETTETFDAPSGGIDYAIPFGRVASIAPPGQVALRSGEELRMERGGDLGDQNAGVLIFVPGRDTPEYVPWAEVARVTFD